MAGRVGVDPGPFTLRELWWMDQGKSKAWWDHTSHILAALCPDKIPADFHPFYRDRREVRERNLIRLDPEQRKQVLQQIFQQYK